MNETLVLGIDGGGTKTIALLAAISENGKPEILGRCTAGSSNVNAVGWEPALANLQAAILGAWNAAKREVAPAEIAVLALSGAGRKLVQSTIASWVADEGIAHRAEVIHDAEAVLLAGTPDGCGVALISGTGAVAMAVDAGKQSNISGGWGYWFGDEGSAYWLGQSALRAVSLASDGRGPETSLTSVILKHLQLDNPREILSALSVNADVRHAIASLASLVIDTAKEGDSVAQAIADEGASHLAKLVISASQAVSLGQEFPLAMAGGVLCGTDYVRDAVGRILRESGLTPSAIETVPEPVLGTLNYACRMR